VEESNDTLPEQTFAKKLRRTTYSPVISLGLLVFALVALAGYLLHEMRWVDHTNRVIERAIYAEKLLLDLQSATRGYFLTKNPILLERYRETRDELPKALRELRDLVSDNPSQSARADYIMGDVHDWLVWVNQTLTTSVASPNAKPATTEVMSGNNRFDHIHDDFATFLGKEYAMRDARAHRATRAAWWSLGIAAALTAIVAAIQCTGMRRRLMAIKETYRTALKQAKERRHRIEELLLELDDELKAVGEIQRSLLPIELPKVHGLDIAASYQTSRRAGGDYYDFFLLPPTSTADDRHRLGILIADVSGHGTAAAVLMAVTHSIAHGFEQPDRPPSDLLDFVNRRLCEGYTNNHSAFVTAFYAIYDPANRQLTYSSAGHNPPRLRAAGSHQLTALDQAQGLPLGVMCESRYDSATLTLAKGDTLVLYTDGITEARDAAGEFLNVEGLDAAILKAKPEANDVMMSAMSAVQEMTGDTVADDRTLLVIRGVADTQKQMDEAPKQALVVESAGADPRAVAKGLVPGARAAEVLSDSAATPAV